MSKKKAGFLVRALASMTDMALLVTPHLLFGLYIVGSQNLSHLGFASILYFVLILGISLALMFFYPYMVSRYGATPGKLVTGLRITDEEGNNLTLRRSLFRSLVGYSFSSLYFGLGYFSIIKDENKQAWHDKAAASRVWVVRPLWPVALLVLLTLIGINGYLGYTAYQRFVTGPLIGKLSQAGSSLFSREGATLTSGEEELAARVAFDREALQLLKGQTKRPIQQLEGYDPETDEPVKVNGIVSEVSSAEAREVVQKLHKKLRAKEYLAFRVEQHFGIDGQLDKVGILKTRDPYEVLRVQYTSGWNYDLSTEDVISKFKEWNINDPLEIIGADTDWVEARLIEKPSSPLSLAQKVYAFCPDVVDQGTETVEELAKEIQQDQTIYCWWD